MTHKEKRERVEKILTAARCGFTLRELAEFHDLTVTYIRILLNRANVTYEKETPGRKTLSSRQAIKRTGTCAFCGKEFESYRQDRVYCSQRCGNSGWRQKERYILAGPPPVRYCDRCGKPFETYRKSQKYCTPKCCRLKNIPLSAVCVRCGAEFEPAHQKQKFCTQSCTHKYHARRQYERVKASRSVSIT